MWFIYILRCKDNSLYTGITKNLEKRIDEHNHSELGAKYTKNKRPVKLVRFKETTDRSQASKIELKIKKMTKSKKEQFIFTSIKET